MLISEHLNLIFFIFVPDEDPEIDVKSKKKAFVP